MLEQLTVRMKRFGLRLLTRPRLDLPLLLALFLLACAGLATLYSAGGGNYSLVGGQAARFVLGGVLLLVISRIPPPVLRSWTPWLYAGSTALLFVVRRWARAGARTAGSISASCASSPRNC